ncbi:NCS2 family permease [Ventrimonas sp. CLA-AP-H27]|uniref:NCS2 family permease n=1 Tax=Ventrimonas faecis TaxID=3133170 RepID=A0ABV1HQB7_9FIRM
MGKREGFFERFFKVSQSGSTMRTEVLAGITTFITVAYILILNPQILADPFAIVGNAEMAAKVSNGVFIGTCIGAFIGTMLCAVYAKVPLAQAPGMGLNAFFAYTVVLGMGYTYNQTLTIVFLSGLLFIMITAVGLRQAIIRAIPEPIKLAITPGIGLFITIIGLKNAGLVVSNPSTLVSMVDFAQWRNGENTALICGAPGCIVWPDRDWRAARKTGKGRDSHWNCMIFVGILMLSNIREVDFSDMTNALPAFCTIVFMPFTYSIANGIAMGLISYCLLKVLSRRRCEVEVLTMVIAVVFAFRYAFMTLG